MNKVVVLALCTVGAALQTGCAGIAFSGHKTPFASLYADVHSNEEVTQNKLGGKRGEACATSILGLVTTGDATVDAAAKTAGISSVGAVEHHLLNYLGIYSKYCVLVSGE